MACLVRRTRNGWDPFQDVWDLQREVEGLLSDVAGGERPAERSGETRQEAWTMPVDVIERKQDLIVRAELSGVRAEDVEVSVLGDTLTIRGERKQEADTTEGGLHRRELAYGMCYRQLALPESIQGEGVKAAYRNGILEVTLPKREEAKPKPIKVDVA